MVNTSASYIPASHQYIAGTISDALAMQVTFGLSLGASLTVVHSEHADCCSFEGGILSVSHDLDKRPKMR